MSDVLNNKTIKGNRFNRQRKAEIEVYKHGIVRIRQSDHVSNIDVVVLTPRQVNEIARLSRNAAER